MALASVVIRCSASRFLACSVSLAFSLAVRWLRSSDLYRFCLDSWIRFIAGDDFLLDFAFHHALDVIEESVFIDADQ